MKILLDLDQTDYILFNSQEEYNADSDSSHSYFANINERNRGVRRAAPITRYSCDPEKFPCILIRGPWVPIANGPDEITATYLYDFEIVENDGDIETSD